MTVIDLICVLDFLITCISFGYAIKKDLFENRK